MYADLTDQNRGSAHCKFLSSSLTFKLLAHSFCAQHGKIAMENSTNYSKTSRNIRISGKFRSKFQNFLGSMSLDPLLKIYAR